MLSSGGGGGAVRLDPNIKTPYGDELSVHLERELFKYSSLRLSYVYKNLRDQDAEVDVARVGAYTVPFAFRDVGPDNVAGTADDQTLNLFDLSTGRPAGPRQNDPRPRTWARPRTTPTFTRWSSGSHVACATVGCCQRSAATSGRPSSRTCKREPAQPPSFGRRRRSCGSPTSVGSAALTETTWNAKVIGRYEGPWGVSASSTLRLNSGYNWGRRITVNLPQAGRENMLAEPVTSNRGLTTKIVDLRLDKTLNIGGSRKLTAIVDVFNVLNSNTVINFTTISGPSFKQVLGLLPPRAVRVGVQFRY